MKSIECIYLIGDGFLAKHLKDILIGYSDHYRLGFNTYSNLEKFLSYIENTEYSDFSHILIIDTSFHSNQYNKIEIEKEDFKRKYKAIKKYLKNNGNLIFFNSMKTIMNTKKYSKFDLLYKKYNKKVLNLSKKYNNIYNLLLPYIIHIDLLYKEKSIFWKLKENKLSKKDLDSKKFTPIIQFRDFLRELMNALDNIIVFNKYPEQISSFKYKYIFNNDLIEIYSDMEIEFGEKLGRDIKKLLGEDEDAI